jgi:hypothetical protein
MIIKLTRFLKNNRLAILITILYVGLSLISVCSVYSADLFYGEWNWIGILFTFPISIISFGFRYGTSEILYPVFIIQGLMLIPTYLIFSKLINRLKRKTNN